jgi:hypothetical protein
VATSVLLVSDQTAGRMPEVCVLTGRRTEHAVRLTAVTWDGPRWLLWVPGFAVATRLLPNHPTFTVALPVSESVWRPWRQRTATAVVVVVFGLTLAVAGLFKSAPLLVLVGVIAVVVALVQRVRAARDYWVTCRFRSDTGTIVVQPTHPSFDAEAKRLFTNSLR